MFHALWDSLYLIFSIADSISLHPIHFILGLLVQTLEDQPWVKDDKVWREGQWTHLQDQGKLKSRDGCFFVRNCRLPI